MTGSVDLLVLGGGPAGLAAAWRAALDGRSVTVLEQADRVGGMAASIEVGGIRADRGSHRLHPATPAPLLADLRALLGEDLQTRPRNGRLQVAQRWVGFPLRAGDLARSLPPALLARMALDAAHAPLRRPEDDTYAGLLRASLGSALYETLYAPYALKLWGLPGERISGEQARKRVTADTPWKVAARILRGSVGRRGDGQGKVFHYPRRGFGQIVEALTQAATDAGATIRTGATVEQVLAEPGGVTVHTAEGGHTSARWAFSTLPLPVLARLASPTPPPPVLEGASRLRFRAMLLVYLVVAPTAALLPGGALRWTPFDAHYLPGGHTPVSRISEPPNYRASAADPLDRTLLCAEVPCDVGDELWRTRDEELAALVAETLARSGLPPAPVLEIVVERLPHVYPIYEVGYERDLAALDAWAAQLPSVTSFGRLGLFAHDNTHHALTMAYEAVAALGGADGAGGADWDEAAWSSARRRFATHVVED
ncbi:MAG: FAD-dependent oxidoreductase [Actinomycetota bacterium]|nr:FAD-dependent oxidoreductase [Actinomycetota bacterium]